MTAMQRSTWVGHALTRLKQLRSFTHWLQQFEPRTEVSNDAIFGRLPARQAPHIYSEREIVDLLAAARRLGPPLALRNADVNLKRWLLTIHQTKFAKSRQVPALTLMPRACNS